ncbi:peptidoglycan editing factor PgeF [Sphaerotilus microaerophilus]|uniref:Purine nucleoside phosphorylase n=1 Tax=Sphaerotilus microaerophilus TaxID=2914710 RepID=A0ABN6PSB6_9BURK|nr:peptidoglycan editing factor PgeF [Sphaerotilus sp. FB-5]BDI06492.1 laccase domain protein [Sphaerotilus sp. FB-5]
MSFEQAAAVPAEGLGWLRPRFTAVNVQAAMTTRLGGISRAPFDGFNVRPGIGDDEAAVAHNRRHLHATLGVPSVRVDQVHGGVVHRIARLSVDPGAPLPVADAIATATVGLACEIQVADCLPVLFADRSGRAVAAAHAGWRGLAAGVLEATLEAVCELAGQPPEAIEAWLGPCIGPAQFEVGADVLRAFGAAPAALTDSARFTRRTGAGADESAVGEVDSKWLADLAGLARDRLAAAGLVHLQGNDGSTGWCTVTNAQRYFSYRRDRHTGRMAALIWRSA